MNAFMIVQDCGMKQACVCIGQILVGKEKGICVTFFEGENVVNLYVLSHNSQKYNLHYIHIMKLMKYTLKKVPL